MFERQMQGVRTLMGLYNITTVQDGKHYRMPDGKTVTAKRNGGLELHYQNGHKQHFPINKFNIMLQKGMIVKL